MEKDIQQIKQTKINLESLLTKMCDNEDYDIMKIKIILPTGTTEFNFGAEFFNYLVSALENEYQDVTGEKL